MVHWTGIVLADESGVDDAMESRLPVWLHPIAGRPLVWHSAAALADLEAGPERLVVLSRTNLPEDLFQDLRVPVEVIVHSPTAEHRSLEIPLPGDGHFVLVVHGAATWEPGSLRELVASPAGSWLPTDSGAAAAWIEGSRLQELLRLPSPLDVPNGVLAMQDGLPSPFRAGIVRDRVQLAEAARRVRDRLVRNLMLGGATFVLPDSVLVDVDVRIGRDSIVYPGAVLEGQTTIGDETVIGPSCRIIDSWVGSGVELKGWNYISHTSVRNRAILEPYVRRGFD